MTRKKTLSAIAVTGLIAALLLAWYATRPSPSYAAPAVAFLTIRGEPMSFSALKGKAVLVNFWATTCEICVKEMPKIVETHRKHEPQGLVTIAVAMPYDPPNRVIGYADRFNLPIRVVSDYDGRLTRAFKDVPGTPAFFVIDRAGRVIDSFLGAPDLARLERSLARALGPG